ncbi:hypothetical protein L4L64_26955, partial [Klebsiella pneumoniae]
RRKVEGGQQGWTAVCGPARCDQSRCRFAGRLLETTGRLDFDIGVQIQRQQQVECLFECWQAFAGEGGTMPAARIESLQHCKIVLAHQTVAIGRPL